ncbi:MAG TPA: hypothetical protein VM240_06900 [Verrucomicrobiae bacterium]|nr:hypothetical protein [Verrucomicrobiae bacterium]
MRNRLLVALILASLAPPSAAEPAFARLYQQQFGYRPACHACHKDGGGTPLNAYGQQFKQGGKTLAAFGKIASRDADGDGVSNSDEATARSNPGNKASIPAAKGPWLETAGLIPKEIQAVFPDVRTWLPKDALLTEADIARAKGLGAHLAKSDENTIYIPVVEQKPVGTALIFPATHAGKTFFLLIATDRQLVVKRVAAMHTDQLPVAAQSKVYANFKGVAVDKLPAGEGDSLDAAITRAVKKAGILLYVRLKNA